MHADSDGATAPSINTIKTSRRRQGARAESPARAPSFWTRAAVAMADDTRGQTHALRSR